MKCFARFRALPAMLFSLALILMASVKLVYADEALTLSTEATVSQDGVVHIRLTVTNNSETPVYHIHPMFHFHHAMVMGGMIHKLDLEKTSSLKTMNTLPYYGLEIIHSWSWFNTKRGWTILRAACKPTPVHFTIRSR